MKTRGGGRRGRGRHAAGYYRALLGCAESDEEEDVGVDSVNYKQLSRKIMSLKYPNVACQVEPKQLTADYLKKTGFREPILVRSTGSSKAVGKKLRMKVPNEKFDVKDVVRLVGKERAVVTIDVGTQQEGPTMSLKAWADYFTTPAVKRKQLLNVVSLKVAGTKMQRLMSAPKAVEDLDVVQHVWPEGDEARPDVLLYCLMSPAGCYTDFHVDMGGSSVWYHVLRGTKAFLLAPPTPQNLETFARWSSSDRQAQVFLGDSLDGCVRGELHSGDTMLIPSGWIHAVATAKDSLVLGGNYIHALDLKSVLAVDELERRLKVEKSCKFPNWRRLMWLTAVRYQRKMQAYIQKPDGAEKISKWEASGLRHLYDALCSWIDKDSKCAGWSYVDFNSPKKILSSLKTALGKYEDKFGDIHSDPCDSSDDDSSNAIGGSSAAATSSDAPSSADVSSSMEVDSEDTSSADTSDAAASGSSSESDHTSEASSSSEEKPDDCDEDDEDDEDDSGHQSNTPMQRAPHLYVPPGRPQAPPATASAKSKAAAAKGKAPPVCIIRGPEDVHGSQSSCSDVYFEDDPTQSVQAVTAAVNAVANACAMIKRRSSMSREAHTAAKLAERALATAEELVKAVQKAASKPNGSKTAAAARGGKGGAGTPQAKKVVSGKMVKMAKLSSVGSGAVETVRSVPAKRTAPSGGAGVSRGTGGPRQGGVVPELSRTTKRSAAQLAAAVEGRAQRQSAGLPAAKRQKASPPVRPGPHPEVSTGVHGKATPQAAVCLTAEQNGASVELGVAEPGAALVRAADAAGAAGCETQTTTGAPAAARVKSEGLCGGRPTVCPESEVAEGEYLPRRKMTRGAVQAVKMKLRSGMRIVKQD